MKQSLQISSPQSTTPRYERKFVLPREFLPDAEFLLKTDPLLFSQTWPPRYVNSLYFDTWDLHCCTDHLQGVPHRLKVRIRWYGGMSGRIEKPFLELKIKQGGIGEKRLFPLPPFTLDASFNKETLSASLRGSSLPDYLKLDLASLNCLLLCRYFRRYYLAAGKLCHANLDDELEYYPIRNAPIPFTRRCPDNDNAILELKYPAEGDSGVEQITNRFPFRMAKHSKYLAGLEKIDQI